MGGHRPLPTRRRPGTEFPIGLVVVGVVFMMIGMPWWAVAIAWFVPAMDLAMMGVRAYSRAMTRRDERHMAECRRKVDVLTTPPFDPIPGWEKLVVVYEKIDSDVSRGMALDFRELIAQERAWRDAQNILEGVEVPAESQDTDEPAPEPEKPAETAFPWEPTSWDQLKDESIPWWLPKGVDPDGTLNTWGNPAERYYVNALTKHHHATYVTGKPEYQRIVQEVRERARVNAGGLRWPPGMDCTVEARCPRCNELGLITWDSVDGIKLQEPRGHRLDEHGLWSCIETPGMERTSLMSCHRCAGTGWVRSTDTGGRVSCVCTVEKPIDKPTMSLVLTKQHCVKCHSVWQSSESSDLCPPCREDPDAHERRIHGLTQSQLEAVRSLKETGILFPNFFGDDAP